MRTILLGLLLCMVGSAYASKLDSLRAHAWGQGPVYHIDVEGLVDNGLARYIDRALTEAESREAALVVLHIDTFGGLVVAADAIRQRILESPVKTLAFVDRNAISAGALIAYAADYIVMSPGSVMGAATVVEGGSGEAASEKAQSAMRALMRTTAEENGRDPKIAEAMVDPTIDLPGLAPEGQLLTLSAQEALREGVSDGTFSSLGALLEDLNLESAELVMHEAKSLETILRFFGSPAVQSILLLMMLGGLYFELQTPGMGFPSAIALVGALLFFAPSYALGLVESWEILVLLLGIGLIVVELFVFPGFGVAGISGLVLTLGALFMMLVGNVGFHFPALPDLSHAILTLAISLVLLIGFAMVLGRSLSHSNAGGLVFEGVMSREAGYESQSRAQVPVGSEGIALTSLRPSGAVQIGDTRYDALAEGDMIERNAHVMVVRVRANEVIVKEVHPPQPS